jgi:hypothetical protein
MSAKKTAKKKPAAKKAAKKAAKVMADVMDSIIETVEPVSIPVHEVFEEDDYNEFAPIAAPKGWASTPEEASSDQEMQGIIAPPETPKPDPVATPSTPSGKPVKALKPSPVAPSPAMPLEELTSDAVIIQRLINGINHLYGIARLTKGIRGPQPEALVRIQSNILAAKELIARLS